jgi:hypothetical protein
MPWRELVAEGHRPSRRTVERYVGQLGRETELDPIKRAALFIRMNDLLRANGAGHHHASASSSALASCKSAVSKPSVNQP